MPSTTRRRIRRLLRAISVGCTRSVLGAVVTRWSEDSYEVDAWGTYRTFTAIQAARLIADRN